MSAGDQGTSHEYKEPVSRSLNWLSDLCDVVVVVVGIAVVVFVLVFVVVVVFQILVVVCRNELLAQNSTVETCEGNLVFVL